MNRIRRLISSSLISSLVAVIPTFLIEELLIANNVASFYERRLIFLGFVFLLTAGVYFSFDRLENLLHSLLDTLEKKEQTYQPNKTAEVPKSGDHLHPILTRLAVFSVGTVLIICGIGLLYVPRTGASFVGTFLCVTGAQIALWAVGIRFEILSNVPTSEGHFLVETAQQRLSAKPDDFADDGKK